MSRIILDITMSLDGIVAGPDMDYKNPLGVGGEQLHDWLFRRKTEQDAVVAAGNASQSGAVIVGGNTYKYAIDEAWGGATPFDMPAFVLTSSVPKRHFDGFTYITSGLETALSQARAAADGKNIWVMGGAITIQRAIAAGSFDELHIHIAPVLFVKGVKLFDNIGSHKIDLEMSEVTGTPGAIHLKYRKTAPAL